MQDRLEHEIAALAERFEVLKQEVRRRGVAGAVRPRHPEPLERALAHSWVNAHQPIAWPEWPPGLVPKVVALLQKVTRRLLSWYITPLVEEQNRYNAAIAESLDLLYQENAALRFQLELSGRAGPQPAPAAAQSRPRFTSPRPPVPDPQRRLRLAFFTPLSPLKTAIADHSEGLLPHLAEFADVDVYIDDGYQPDLAEIVEHFDIYNHRRFPVVAYDAVLYAIGDNSDFHTYIFEALQRQPGVVILHDTTLHRFAIGRTLARGDTEGYLDELEYASGLRDLRPAEQILAGYGEAIIRRFPLFERVVDLAQGVIVHNEYARSQILQRRPRAPVTCIGQHFFLPPGFPEQVDVAALRAELGLTGRFVVASFGIFVPDKRLDSCLGAFARFAARHPEAVYLFAGNYRDYDLPAKVQSLGLEDRVIVTGWLDPIRFTELMFVADIGVHLRYPHIGGTPFSPVRMMGLGIPTIVSDIGPLSGFPEGCCLKIAPDEWEEATLQASFELLAGDPDLRQRLADNGRRFLTTYHDAGTIARQYLDFMREATEKEAAS